MSADNYLAVEERRDGWCVVERRLSDDDETIGRKLSGPHPTPIRAMMELPRLAEQIHPEHGVRLDQIIRTKIIVEPRSDDVMAFIDGHRELWDYGRSPAEAVGKLLMAHGTYFAVEINTE